MIQQITDNYETETLQLNPLVRLSEKELDIIILKMGSLLSILCNKKNNQAKLLIATVKNKYFGQVFLDLADIDNLQLLVRHILNRYPTVSKSKIVINSLITHEHK